VRAPAGLSPKHRFDTFEEIITTLEHSGPISMHRSGAPQTEEATVEAPRGTLREVFISGVRPAQPLNFLDIADHTGLQHKPDDIIGVDLVRRIQLLGGERFAEKKGFVILSQAGSISPFHIDKAGANTWITTLRGTKVWFVARGNNAQLLFFEHKSLFSNYDRIYRIPLVKGDTLYVLRG
jgi:hypothetical protein